MKVIITGSESTGKTELASFLGAHFNAPWVPEFARDFIANLKRTYTYEDVEEIARFQIRQIDESIDSKLVFFDTGLVITKVWFEWKFKRVPEWFEKVYKSYSSGYYLICDHDLPWIPDPVRENPDIRRELDQIYVKKISDLKMPFKRVSGVGENRKNQAVKFVNEWLALQNE